MKYLISISFLLLIQISILEPVLFAQKKKQKRKSKQELYGKSIDDLSVLGLGVIDGDTIPIYNFLDAVVVSTKKRTAAEQRAYRKLKRNLVKVYPYAQRATLLLNEMEKATADMRRSKRKKKKYVKALEKELKGHFEQELKKLTTSQGKVLIKLLERETGEPFYKLLKQLKNPFSAFVWNTVSKRYGYNLKEGYDSEKNQDLEELVSALEENGLQALGYKRHPKSKALEATSNITAPKKYRKN